MSLWTHPTHAKGVRSPWPSVQVGKVLTDAVIERYCRKGYYGTEAKALADERHNARVAARKAKQTEKKKLRSLLSFLDSL